MVNSINAVDASALPFKHHCTSVYWRNVIKDECSSRASVPQIELLLRSVRKEMRWKKGEKADLTSPQKPIKPQDTPKHTSHKSTCSPLKGNTEGQLNVTLCEVNNRCRDITEFIIIGSLSTSGWIGRRVKVKGKRNEWEGWDRGRRREQKQSEQSISVKWRRRRTD